MKLNNLTRLGNSGDEAFAISSVLKRENMTLLIVVVVVVVFIVVIVVVVDLIVDQIGIFQA